MERSKTQLSLSTHAITLLVAIVFSLVSNALFGEISLKDSTDILLFENRQVSISLHPVSIEKDPKLTWRWGSYTKVELLVTDKNNQKTLRVGNLQLFVGDLGSIAEPILSAESDLTRNEQVNIRDIDSDGILDCVLIYNANSMEMRKTFIVVSLEKSGPRLSIFEKFFRRDPGDGDYKLNTINFQKRSGRLQATVKYDFGGPGEHTLLRNEKSGKYE